MIRWFLIPLIALAFSLFADGPKDNIPDNVRPIPPKGVEVPPEKRAKMEAGLAEFKQSIEALRKKDAKTVDLLPDVEIFYRAVHDGLKYNEFLKPEDIDVAFKLLDIGKQRAADLAEGKAPWTTQTGLVVRGYISRIDNSVQPYGLLIPESYSFTGATRHRLDLWFHGRVEYLTEGFFLNLRMTKPDQIALYNPRDTVVLYPYGRFCNASKFAGEVDGLEALAEVQRRYRIDSERISARGFSMGGAASWHFAVHHADKFFAANPGAGFSETPRFLEFFQKETLNPFPWEKKLWAWYDCDKVVLNLAQVPTIAYSGADDIQKQAADVMVEAAKKHNVNLRHIVAPNTTHKVEPAAAKVVEELMEAWARDGRNRVPSNIVFETYTLKYNRMHWVTIDGLQEHWARAAVFAAMVRPSFLTVKTTNVSAITFTLKAGECPYDLNTPLTITIDDQEINNAPRALPDRSWSASFVRDGNTWKLGSVPATAVVKRHDLQGPIDDAFMDAFIFVRPTQTSANEAVGKWVNSELERAIETWRRHFRGYAIVKDDNAVTDDDIATKHLVLWGDPSSNTLIKKIADKLALKWDAKTVAAGPKSYDAAHHAAILIQPNPLNPSRYVVLNSSFTFREYAYLNNARQVPMLPDWAVIDVREPATTIRPGKIADAGFFDEQWKWKEESK